MTNEIIVVGGGISGLTSALYLARAGYKVNVFNGYSFGNLTDTKLVENYPGFINGISGAELLENINEQVKNNNVNIFDEKIEKIFPVEHRVVTDIEEEYHYDILICATGCSPRKLECLNYQKYEYKNIHYCAICDGTLYKDKEVVVLGGGNTAITEALYLSDICKKVYLIHRRDEFRAEKILVDKLKLKSNIEIVFNSNICSFEGKENLEYIILDNGLKIFVSGCFVAIGFEKNDFLLKDMLDGNEIDMKNEYQTVFRDVFICGDLKNKYKQAIIAAGDGAKCAFYVMEYLNSKI